MKDQINTDNQHLGSVCVGGWGVEVWGGGWVCRGVSVTIPGNVVQKIWTKCLGGIWQHLEM